MASFLDKFKIKTAVDNYTKLDLGCDHISSANFMQFNVAYSKEMVPGEKLSVNMETFTRLAPMPVPTFGRAKINNRAFFVPFRTIFPGWNDFITDTSHVNANGNAVIVSSVPTISAINLSNCFTGSASEFYGAYSQTVDGEDTPYDYGDGRNKYKLTAFGRQTMKILESLGYKFVIGSQDTTTFSALPLLAIAKVYCDWYYPSAYTADTIFSNVESIFKQDTGLSAYSLTTDDLNNIFSLLRYVCYDSDYFVSAWDNPTTPNTGAYSAVTMSDITTDTFRINTGTGYGTPVVTQSNGNQPGVVSQYALTALRSLTDYMKRHQLVGARALDRYLSRFGVTLSAEKLNRSIYIGNSSSGLQFGDIMSQADTEGAQLGDYAGKGIGYDKVGFDYNTDEYGMFIIISTIIPNTGYYQGLNRTVMHKSKLDFWTPEFDNLGTQAIAKGELYVPQKFEGFNGTFGGLTTGVFGWTPRYAEYKVGRDMLTGDFRYDTINTGQEAWHTLREVDYTTSENIAHNRLFTVGQDSDQYSRIFYNTDADAADKFNVIYHFEVGSQSPMKPLYDTYEFEDQGKEMVVDVNGVKMN